MGYFRTDIFSQPNFINDKFMSDTKKREGEKERKKERKKKEKKGSQTPSHDQCLSDTNNCISFSLLFRDFFEKCRTAIFG